MARFQLVLQESAGNQFLLFESSQPGGPALQGQPLREGRTIVFRGRRWRVRLDSVKSSPGAPQRFRLLPAAR